MLLEEPEESRFRISQEAVQPVVEEQLIPVEISDANFAFTEDGKSFVISGLQSEFGDEDF